MKKIAKFNPNVRSVGEVLTHSVSWALFSNVRTVMKYVARSHPLPAPDHHPNLNDRQLTNPLPPNEGRDRRFLSDYHPPIPTVVLNIVRHLTVKGFVALHHSRSPISINGHDRLQSTFHSETIDGESRLHMIVADRRPHPTQKAKSTTPIYVVCHYYIYPDRKTDNVRWEIETFNSVTPERLDSYLPPPGESKYYPPLEGVKLACISYLNYGFGQATSRRGPEIKSLAIQTNQLITAMGTLSTQALLDEMRVRWVAKLSDISDNIWSAQEKHYIDVPTYPFEFNVDPTQRVKSPHPEYDDCEVWELFVYRVENDAMSTTSIVRYTNEYRVLNKLGTSVSDRQARRHARLATKYQVMARIIREVGLNPPGDNIDIYSDRLGAKIVKES
jgi:hypothetical protein